MTIEAYCMKCRTMRTITAAVEHVNARGTRMAQGPCPVCGTTVTKFLPKAVAKAEAPPAASTPAAKAAPASKPAPKAKSSSTGGGVPAAAGSTKRGSKKGG